MPLLGCPSQQEWLAFHFGQLPAESLDAFREHLESCGRCEDSLQSFDPLTDPVIAALRLPSFTASGERLTGGAADTHASRADPHPGGIEGMPSRPEEMPSLDFLAPAEANDELGRLAHFRVLKVLGQGGMGIVFLAEDSQLRRQVALKVLKPELAANSNARQRFLREARAVAALRNDHIIVVHQVGEAGTIPYLAMERLEGETLDSWRRHLGSPSVPQFVQVAREIAEALAAAHDQGLIHRDIKPTNIWVEPRPGGAFRVKVLDFGLALTEMGDTRLTRMGTLVGTPAYMSPEMAEGRRLDARCDLFCLGSVLYYLATGTAPFAGESTVAALWAVSFKQPPPVSRLNPLLPQALAELVMRLLAKDPDDRPQSARALLDHLQAIDAGTDHSTATFPRRPFMGPRSRRIWLIPIALLLVGVIALGIWLALHRHGNHVHHPRPDTGSPIVQPTGTALTRQAEEEAWLKAVADMRPKEQLYAVVSRLKKLNADYDGTLGSRVTVTDGGVIELSIPSDQVTDLSPLRALKKLQYLDISSSKVGERAALADLSPLAGLPLTDLRVVWTSVANMAALREMPLGRLSVERTLVHDLEPLRNQSRLTILVCGHTAVADLSPLQDVPLELLSIEYTRVADLSPLRKAPLKHLNCSNSLVADLWPLSGKPLIYLKCGMSRVTNLEPLRSMKLEYLGATIDKARDAKILQGIESLKSINDIPVATFWKQD